MFYRQRQQMPHALNRVWRHPFILVRGVVWLMVRRIRRHPIHKPVHPSCSIIFLVKAYRRRTPILGYLPSEFIGIQLPRLMKGVSVEWIAHQLENICVEVSDSQVESGRDWKLGRTRKSSTSF